MKTGAGARYAVGAAAVAAVSCLVAARWAPRVAGGAGRWAVLGWAAMAIPGVACGAWLAREHGRPGSRFLVALGTGILWRLVAAAASVAWVARADGEDLESLLLGLAAGFVPLQAFEVVWFYRTGRLKKGVS